MSFYLEYIIANLALVLQNVFEEGEIDLQQLVCRTIQSSLPLDINNWTTRHQQTGVSGVDIKWAK